MFKHSSRKPVEGFDEGVFHGFSGPNEIELYAALIWLVLERPPSTEDNESWAKTVV
jgi:hypothetical protein